MATEIAICVTDALRTLNVAALDILRDQMNTQIALIDYYVSESQGRLLQYDVLGQGADYLADIAETFLDKFKREMNALPLGLVPATCTQMVGLSGGLNANMQIPIQKAKDYLNKVRRAASFREELVEVINTKNEFKDLLSAMVDKIQEIIDEKLQA